MNDYSKYKKCVFCGKYNMPPSVYPIVGPGYRYMRTDYSMVCNGIQTFGPDPFAEEIHGDHTDYLMCEGERYESSMDI